jgi:hypothetical protein
LSFQDLFYIYRYITNWRPHMTKEKREAIRYSAWLNLFIGIYNMYLYSIGGDLFWNFLIGSLNIGVWVFFRKV